MSKEICIPDRGPIPVMYYAVMPETSPLIYLESKAPELITIKKIPLYAQAINYRQLEYRYTFPGKKVKDLTKEKNKVEDKLNKLSFFYRHPSATEHERQNLLFRIADVKKRMKIIKDEIIRLSKIDRLKIALTSIVSFFRYYGFWHRDLFQDTVLIIYSETEDQRRLKSLIDYCCSFSDNYEEVPRALPEPFNQNFKETFW